jgi:glutamine amidotransferase/cyclase
MARPGFANDREWILATTDYGCEFVAAVQRGNIFATQFHPEKSGKAGLALLQRFLACTGPLDQLSPLPGLLPSVFHPTQLAPRVIACLDVRSNDAGDLVVTKGDQ